MRRILGDMGDKGDKRVCARCESARDSGTVSTSIVAVVASSVAGPSAA